MKKNAFTLIELSIVLIIISMILGGIIGGTALIDLNMQRSIIVDINKYQSAMTLFKNQYGYYPGDFPKATSFFTQSLNTVNNGNGNDKIEMGTEDFYAWQHLALAGMINGNFTGAASTPNNYNPGINIPSTKIFNTGFAFDSATVYGSAYSALGIASNIQSNSGYLNGAATTPSFAKQIDSKIDDGIASSGKILTLRAAAISGNSVCVNQGYSTAPTGNVTYLNSVDKTTSCRIWYIYN